MGFLSPFLSLGKHCFEEELSIPHQIMGLRLRMIVFLYLGLTYTKAGQTWTGRY